MELTAFKAPIDAVVVGANGGLGHSFVKSLCEDCGVRTVHAWSRHALDIAHDKVVSRTLDVGDETQLESAVREIDRLTLIIVATGFLHDENGLYPEKSYKSLDPSHMIESFRVNAILPALIAKYTLPLLPRNERALYCALSARVGSISDNRIGGWHSYRAGKAALNQIIKCLSIELRRTHKQAVCIGLHPGTVDTGLSRPFQKSLAPTHNLFTPGKAVANLLNVIDHASCVQSGSVLAWDCSVIPA